MSRTWWTGIAVVAAVLAATALASVQVRNARQQPAGADLTGTWVLDASRSGLPAGPGGRGWRGRAPDETGQGREGEPGHETRGPRRGGRGSRMPRVMQVTQTGGVVSFADSTGALVQIVRVGGTSAPEPGLDHGARELTGTWEDGTLIAKGSGPRGGTIVRSYRLTDNGRALEIRTRRKGGRSRPDSDAGSDGPRAGSRRFGRGELTWIYRRAS